MSVTVISQLHFLFLVFLWFACACVGAYLSGFFKINTYPSLFPPYVTKGSVLKAFAIFLVIQLLLFPILAIIAAKVLGFNISVFTHLNTEARGWINLSLILTLMVCLSVYIFYFKPLPSHLFSLKHVTTDFLLAFVAWFIGFPLVIFISQGMDLLFEWQFGTKPIEQVAVNQLKSTYSDPFLVISTVISIVIFAPILEEILFRGFLQTWLRSRFKPLIAISLTSFIFAGFHFSISQGITNITLICSLFILSCFLGFLYERQKTLWSSISLHAIFNGINVWMILHA